MDKAFMVGTLFFSWIITIGLVVFTIFAFKYASIFIAIALVVITFFAISANLLLQKKWKSEKQLKQVDKK